MNPEDLHDAIAQAVPGLLELARGLSRNTISDNCVFIMSEIRNDVQLADVQQARVTKENAAKIPRTLREITTVLETFFHDIYDINLYIHRARKNQTIIDIRYYLKSSMDAGYRGSVQDNPPMLHSKVALPPWRSPDDGRTRFDINWERKTWLNRWRIYLSGWRSRSPREGQ